MTEHHAAAEPIPVRHEPGSVAKEIFQGVSKAFSPDISTFSTVVLPASSSLPVQILPRDPRRFKATVTNTGTTGVAIVGTSAGVANGIGGQIPVNGKFEFYSGREHFAVALGATAAQLTVLIETFSQAEPEAA